MRLLEICILLVFSGPSSQLSIIFKKEKITWEYRNCSRVGFIYFFSQLLFLCSRLSLPRCFASCEVWNACIPCSCMLSCHKIEVYLTGESNDLNWMIRPLSTCLLFAQSLPFTLFWALPTMYLLHAFHIEYTFCFWHSVIWMTVRAGVVWKIRF